MPWRCVWERLHVLPRRAGCCQLQLMAYTSELRTISTEANGVPKRSATHTAQCVTADRSAMPSLCETRLVGLLLTARRSVTLYS